MPPPNIATICQPMPVNATTAPDTSDMEDRNALLYIVVTLLFYSMGIVIGIITYLKREQAEMEEDKMFEVYLHMKREPFNLHKLERVNQMALYLKQLEERKVEMEKAHRWKGSGSDQQLHHPLCPHQQLQLQREQHSDSQLYPEARKLSTPLPCAVCHAGTHVGDHIDPHHLQPYTSRSRHSSGKETPAGTPALLCSLTLNVCEPFLSPDTLPKAALPFRPPSPRDGGHSSFRNYSHPALQKENSSEPSAFGNDTSVLKTLPSSSDACPPDGLYRQLNNNDGNQMHVGKGETVVELQPLGYTFISDREQNQDVFQKPCMQPSLPDENPQGGQLNESNNDNLHNSGPKYRPSLVLPLSSPSPTLYSRALSIDQAPTSSGRNKLKRQLSLHNERSLPSTHKPPLLSRQPTQGIEEEDSKMARLSGSDGSAVCEAEEIYKSSAESETPNFSIDTDSTDQMNSEECSDQLPKSPPRNPHETAPLGTLSISHSDPLLPHKLLPSPKSSDKVVPTSKPRDARPKIFSLFEKSDNEGKGVHQGANTSTASPDQGRGRLRRTILEAWRENSPQSVDIPEITKAYKTVPSNTSFPSFLKSKNQQSQPEVTRSTFPRAPGPREERRGALFLSQKSLLHSSGNSPKSGGESRVPQQHRVGSGHRSGLPYQASVDFTARTSPDQGIASFQPLLDSDHLLSSERDMSSEDSSGLAPLMSSHRDPATRIPKLSRARTVDTSTLLRK